MSKERELLKKALNALTKELMAGPLLPESLDVIDEIQQVLGEPEVQHVALADYRELQRKFSVLIAEYKELEQTFNHATGAQWIRKSPITEDSHG